MALPESNCFLGLPPEERLLAMYQALLAINAAVGGDVGSDEYESAPEIVTASGSIPAGVLGWSFTAISGTVTLNGDTIPIGVTVSGGGYGSKTLKTAIAYTITAGSAAVTLDTPE